MASNQDTKEKYRQLQEYLPFIERTIAKHEQISRNQVENNQLQRLQGLHKFLKQPPEQLLNMAVLEKVEAVIQNIHSQQMSAAQRRPAGQDWDPRRDIRHNRDEHPRGREHDSRHNQDLEAERRAQDWESSDNDRIRDGRDRGQNKSFDRGSTDRERNFERSTSREYSRSSSKEYERGNSSRERDHNRANISRERDYDKSSSSKERDSRGNSSRETDSNQSDIFRERRQRSLLDLPMPPVAPDPVMPHSSSGSWRHQNKPESRQDERVDRDRDSRYNQRPDTRNDTRYDDSRFDSRSDAKQMPRQEHRSELRLEPKQDPRHVPKGDPRHDSHNERRYDRRQESRPRTDITIPLERISRENSSDRPGTHSEHSNTSWREDSRNRENISNRISQSNSGVERGDLRHSRPPEVDKDARGDISKGLRDQKPWDNLSPSQSTSTQIWRMGKQQQQQQQKYPPGPQIKQPIISSQHTKGLPPDTPESPDMSPSGEFGVDDTPQSPEASFSPTPPADGEILNRVKTIPLDSIKQGVDLSLVKKALASLKKSDKTQSESNKPQSQRPNSAQSYRYEDFVGPATTSKTKDDEPYDPEEVWKTETEVNPKKSPRADVDHRQIILGLSNQKKLTHQTSQQNSTDMKMAKDKLCDIPLPPTMSTLAQKSPFPRDISKPIESNVAKTSLGSISSPPTANKISSLSNKISSLFDKSNRGLNNENVSLKSKPGVLGFQSKLTVPSPSSSPVGSSQLSQSSKHGNHLNQAPAARSHESSTASGTSVASGLSNARSRDPRTKDDNGDVDMRSPQSTPNIKSPLSQSSPGTGTEKMEGLVERDDSSRIENIRARMEERASEFIKPGQKGVAMSQLEKYKQKKERRLSGSSEIKSPPLDGNKSKPVSVLGSLLPNENEDDLTPEPMQLEEDSSPPPISSRDPRRNNPEGSSDSFGSSVISRDPRMTSSVSSQSMIAGSRDPRSIRDPRMENVNRDPRRDLVNRDPRHGLPNRDPRQELLNRDGRQAIREPRVELSNRDPRNNSSQRDTRHDQSISRDINPNAFPRRDPRQEAMLSRDPRNSNFNSKDPRADSSLRSQTHPIGQLGPMNLQGTPMRDPRFGGNFERSIPSREMWPQTNSPISRAGPQIGMGGPQVAMNVPPASVGMAGPPVMGSNYPSHRVSVPPPSSPQPPLHPAEPVADSLLSAGGSASLISDTYTCLMAKGLPYFANSSYVYHFFEEYLLRDIVIELDYKYQCKGTAYVHFPSHSSAKEAYEKLNGWMMNGCPISLKHITVGFVRQAKNAYEVKNRERESRLGLPEKPRGNGNPYYKPRPPKPPTPPPLPPPSPTTVQEPSELKKEPETKDAQVKDNEIEEQKSHHSDLCGVKVPAKNSTILKSFKIPKKKKIEPPIETPMRDSTPPRELFADKMETKKDIKLFKSSKSITNSKNAVETIKNPKIILNKIDKLKKPVNEDRGNGSSSDSSTESLEVPTKHKKSTTKKKRLSKIMIVTDSDSSNSDEKPVNKSHDKVFSTADSDSDDDLVIDSSNFHHEDDDVEDGDEDEESETSSQDSEDSLEKPKGRNKNLKSETKAASSKVSHSKRNQISKKKGAMKNTSSTIAKSKINVKTKAPKRTGRTKKMDPLDGSKITRQNQLKFEKVVILKKRLKVSFPVPQKIMVSLFLNEKKNARGKGGKKRTEGVDILDEEVEPVLKDLFKIENDTATEELKSDKVLNKISEDVKDVITFGVKKKKELNYSLSASDNVPWIVTNFLKKEWVNTVRPGYINRGKKRKNITNDMKNKRARKCEGLIHQDLSKTIKGENEAHKEVNYFDGVNIEKSKVKQIDNTDGVKMVGTKVEKDYETDDEIGNRFDAIDSNSDSDEDVVFGVPQSIAQKLQTKRSLEEDSDSPDMNTMRKMDKSESPEHKKNKCDTSFDAIVISDKETISDSDTNKEKEQPNEPSEFLPFSAADLLDDNDVNDEIPPLSSSVMAAWLNDVDPRIVADLPDARELARVLSVNDNEDIDDHWPSKVSGNHDKTPITIETTVDNQSTSKKSSKSTYNSQLDLSNKRNNKDDISGFAFKLKMCEQGKGHETSSNFTYNSLLDVSEKAGKSSDVEQTQIIPLKLNFDESKKTRTIAENEIIPSKYESSKIEKTVEKKAKKAKVQKKTKVKVKENSKSKNVQESPSKEVTSKAQIDIQNTIESVIAHNMSKSVEGEETEIDTDMELLPSLDPSENIDFGIDKQTKLSTVVSSTEKDIPKPLGKSTEKKVNRKRKKSASSIDESSALSLDNKTEDELDDGDDETGSIIGSVCSLTDDAASMMSGEGGRELKTPDSSSSKKSKRSRNTPMPPQGWRRVTRGAKVETLDVEVTDWDDGGVVDLFQCDLCQFVGRHRVSHLVNFHAEREVPCEFKKEDFGPVLRDHVGPPSIPDDPGDIDLSWIPNKMTFDDNVKCIEEDCEYTSTIRFDLIYHYLDHYPKAAHLVYHCRFCNYMTDNMEMLYDHVSSHTGEYRHSCDRCGHKSYKLSSIHEHHKETHGKMSKSITSKKLILEDGWPYIYVCKQCTFARIHVSETETHIQQRHHGKAEIHRSNMTRCIVAHVEKFGLLSKDEDTAKPKAKGKKRKKGQKEPDFKVFLGEDIEDDCQERIQQLIDRISINKYTPSSTMKIHKRMTLLNTISEKLNKVDEIEDTNESDHTEIVNDGTKSSPVKMLGEKLNSQEALSPRQSPKPYAKLSETVAPDEEGNAKEVQSESLDKRSEEEIEDPNKELSNIEGETDDDDDDEESDYEKEELDKDELMKILKGNALNNPIFNILGNTIQKLTANLIHKEEEKEKERAQSEAAAAAALSSQDSDNDSDSDSDNLVICEDEEESVKPNAKVNVSLTSPSKGPRIRILSAGEINKGTTTSVGGRTFKCGTEKCNYSSNDNKDLITHIISKHGAFKCISQGCPYIGTTRTDFQSHMYRMHNNPKLSLLVCPFQCVISLQTIEQLGAHLAQHDLYPNMHNSPFTEQSPPHPGFPSPMKSPAATNSVDESGNDESMFKIVGVSTLAPTVASQLFGDAEAMRSKVTSPMIGALSPRPIKPVPTVVTLDDNDDIPEPPISCAKPSAPQVSTAVPGMSSLPSQPPTVPIEIVFVNYQTPNNFKMLTTKLAPEIFKCMTNQCLYADDNQDAFLNHLEKHQEQNEKDFRCCYCLIALPTPKDLIQHVITEHSHCQFQCKYCLYRALSTIYMGVHLKNFHPRDEPRYIKVPTINQSAPPNPGIDNFVRPYKCSFATCQYKTVDAEAFKSHVSDLHGQFAVIACGYCHVHLNVQSLIDHMRLHDINEYQCPYCLHGESEKDHLLRHLLNCHPGRPGKVLLRKQLRQQSTAQGESGAASSTSRQLKSPPHPSTGHISTPHNDMGPGTRQTSSSSAVTDTATSQGNNATSQGSGNQSLRNQEKGSSPVKPTPNQTTSKESDTTITRETRSSREMQFLAIVSAAARRETPGAAGVEGAEGTSGVIGEGGLGSTEKIGLSGVALYRCGNKGCQHTTKTYLLLKEHLQVYIVQLVHHDFMVFSSDANPPNH